MTYRVWLRDEDNDDKVVTIDVDTMHILDGGVLHCRVEADKIDMWYSPAEWTTVERTR